MLKKIDHAADHSLKLIRMQFLKAGLVIALIVILTVHQFDFLYYAVVSHPELNILIIAIFVFGVIVAVRSLFALVQDDRALRWMKETHSDFELMKTQPHDDGLKRLMRISQPAKLFHTPRIFNPVFEQASEELMLNRSFHVSLAQRSTLMGMVHEEISREKSLVNYITGLLILLGLIGTFIGLMDMVASVGDIVGGLAKAGSGSDDAIRSVIMDLEAPLTGMATGFSASLFGLLGSLLLGLIARFGQTAMLAVKQDLEHWLARISQLEVPQTTAQAFHGGSGAPVAALAASLVGSFRTIQGILVRSADVMRKLADRQDSQTESMTRLTNAIDSLSTRQEQALWQLRRVDAIGDAVESLRSESIAGNKTIAHRITTELGLISDTLDEIDTRQASRHADLVEQYRATERFSHSLEIQTNRSFEELSLKSAAVIAEQADVKKAVYESQLAIVERLRDHTKPLDFIAVADRLGAGIDERLAVGFGAIAYSFEKSLSDLAKSLVHFGESQSLAIKKIDDITSHPVADELRHLGQSIETGLASGFSDLARILDVLITAQAASAAGQEGRSENFVDTRSTGDSKTVENDSRYGVEPRDYSAVMAALRQSGREPSA